MPDKPPQYLDANGNPMDDAPMYLDAQGNPITPRQTAAPAPPRTWVDTAVDTLPAIGGAVGGALGAATGIPTLGLTSLPAGIAGAGILGAGGEALRQTINRLRGQAAPGTPAAAAGDIALQGAEQGGLEAAGGVATKALSEGGRAVYRGYLKPSLARVNLGKARQVVDTAIQEALPMTTGGLQHARDLIGQLNAQVNDMLASVPGKTVDLSEMANRVRAFAQRTYNRPGVDPAEFEAAMKVADRIDAHPSLGPQAADSAPMADLTEANQIKRNLQQGVGVNQYGIKSKAATTAQKVGASELRQQIEQQAGEAGLNQIGPLNAREGRLLEVARSLQRATERDANRDKLIGTRAIAAAAGGIYGGEDYYRRRDPYGAAVKGLALYAGLQPAIATRAAILAARLGDAVPGAAVADVARAAIRAASEAEQEPESGVQDVAKQ